MGGVPYTKEQIDFLLAKGNVPWPMNSREFLENIAAEFTEKFGRLSSAGKVKCILNSYNIRKGYQRRPQKQIDFIFAKAEMGLTAKTIAAEFAERFGLPCREKYIYNFLYYHHIRKGYENCKKACHKLRYKRLLSVGTERMRLVHNTPVIYIKVAEPNVWKIKHHVLWEKANGPLPEGYAVIFADGNRENFALGNLIKVSMGELAWLKHKGISYRDAELTESAVLLARISIMAGKREKEVFGKRRKKRLRIGADEAMVAVDEAEREDG